MRGLTVHDGVGPAAGGWDVHCGANHARYHRHIGNAPRRPDHPRMPAVQPHTSGRPRVRTTGPPARRTRPRAPGTGARRGDRDRHREGGELGGVQHARTTESHVETGGSTGKPYLTGRERAGNLGSLPLSC